LPLSANGSRISSCSATSRTAPSATLNCWNRYAANWSPASKERHDMAKPKSDGIAELRVIVEDAFERRATLTPTEIDGSTRPAVDGTGNRTAGVGSIARRRAGQGRLAG